MNEITVTDLKENNFKMNSSGDYELPLSDTHRIVLMPTVESDGLWYYPIIQMVPEISNEEIQSVSLRRIKYLNELQVLLLLKIML
jgi:hypothetical protein